MPCNSDHKNSWCPRDVFEQKVKEIAELTDLNLHIEALIAGAELLDDDVLSSRASALQGRHEYKGHLDMNMQAEKMQIYKMLMNNAKASFSKEWYDKFYMAY